MTSTSDDNAVHAARELHEDRVSENVARIQKRLTGKLWVLFHAKNYLLGVLQLLENAHLLRDIVQEEKDAESHKQMVKAFGPKVTPREKGYKALCYAAAPALPPTFLEAVQGLSGVRTDEELDAAYAPSRLAVHGWRHGGSSDDALALARVHKLVRDKGRLKTVSVQALRDALGIREDDGR